MDVKVWPPLRDFLPDRLISPSNDIEPMGWLEINNPAVTPMSERGTVSQIIKGCLPAFQA